MDELVRWLGEQLDEDERIAKRAASMKFDLPSDAPWERARLLIEQGRAAADERHIAAHDPARVLREIDAKRRIIAEHTVTETSEFEGKTGTITYCPLCRNDGDCPTLRLLASVYADRPGYREEWAP